MKRLGEFTGGDAELAHEILQEALSSCERDLAELSTLVVASEPSTIGDMAHRIKGAAWIIADQALIRCCEAAEQACAELVIDPARIERLALRLQQAQMALVEGLRAASNSFAASTRPLPVC